MMRNSLYLITVIMLLPLLVYGQEGLNYQMTMISNPAVTGSEANGKIRLAYLNYYPGNSYNLHSVSLSYDSYFPSLHGGAGIYLLDDYLGGIVNNLQGGVSYSYFFRASENLYISAGLSASLYHRGYDFSGAVLPDQIDPLLGAVTSSGETLSSRGRTVFDLATGFLFISGRFYGGFSINHLAEPDPGKSDDNQGKLKRTLLIHGAADLDISTEKHIRALPLAMAEMGNGFFSAGAGVSVESKYLSLNAIVLVDNEENIDLQTGFSITTGSLMLFYNYRFNIVSGDNLLPNSLLHHTGIVFSLNNVDKRKIIKTINFPKL
jgi:type IX secretion system PorP/SprF family membrane protein